MLEDGFVVCMASRARLATLSALQAGRENSRSAQGYSMVFSFSFMYFLCIVLSSLILNTAPTSPKVP